MKCHENYQNVTQRHEVSTCYCKKNWQWLAGFRVATNLQFIKNALSGKCNKTKGSKRGMPVILTITYDQINKV